MFYNEEIYIGDVFLVDFDGSYNEQHGVRPAVIIQNNKGNQFSPNVIVIPLTSSNKKMCQPTHVFIDSNDVNLKVDSIALCENPVTISKERLRKYLTKMPDSYMKRITVASLISLGILQYVDIDSIASAKEYSELINNTTYHV